ncbi:S8 family serine peptidase [Actinokineospora globicatena]|uniref:S8 family serine peptidase n=1 Tax=Actinokineospora globicatena TaxID=103729 RepID=UPI0020A3EF5D|nr:S8 family serine peptidase [Actinokineospora globicatena]
MRDRPGRGRMGVAAAVALAAAIAMGPVAEAEARAAPVAVAAAGQRGQVTLVTGDHVTLVGKHATVRPGPGRRHVTFVQRLDERGDVNVFPSDVVADIGAGKLDRRLFDVTALVRDGFDDRTSKATPLIVTYDGAAPRIAGEARALPSIGGASFALPKGTPLGTTRSAGFAKVWLDGKVTASLDRSVPQIGAPEAWRSGLTGKGVKVAVLDTGIDTTHPDLAGAVVLSRDFSGSADADDRIGHGTHVAATITGSGRYQGVAPDSALLNGKVLGDNGDGSESDVIAGMEWAAAEGAAVINLSLGSNRPSAGDDPASLAVNRLTAETGALFVVSAGNSGGEMGAPAAADAALTVGAVDRTDALAPFSSRGPRFRDGAIKPDITAPGVGIVAARAANGQIGDPVGDKHVALSGTSMAAPHVAGAAALLAGQHPDWKADRLKAALVGTAKPNPALTPFEQGGGRVDVARATTQPVTADAASLSLGLARWPHHDDPVITRTLTYRNTGTAPVTLEVDVPGQPAGLFTVSPSRVVVPAGGQASVRVSADTKVPAAEKVHVGAVVATGGTAVVRTPIAVDKEVESYDVTVEFKDLPSEVFGHVYWLTDLNQPRGFINFDSPASSVTRVPKGTYYFDGHSIGEVVVAAYEPNLVVAKDVTLVLDSAKSKRVEYSVDRPDAEAGAAESLFQVTTSWGTTGSGIGGPDFDFVRFIPSTTSAPKDKATFTLRGRFAKPDGEGGFVGSPYQYGVGVVYPGRVPADLKRHFRDRDLVSVRTEAAAQGKGAVGTFSDLTRLPLPARLDQRYSPDLPWYDSFTQGTSVYEPDAVQVADEPTVYRRGETAVQRWNTGVFAASLPDSPYAGVFRMGDEVAADIPLYADQEPKHSGYSRVAVGSTELYRDGELVTKSEWPGSARAVVPPGKGSYRLRTEATRGAPFELTTKQSAEWTFTSEHTTGDVPSRVKLPVVRFAPPLDDYNQAKAGRLFVLPVYTQRSGEAGVSTPTVQVSYDDGATWRPAPVVANGDKSFALLYHPAGAKFVSLKATAKAVDGATVDQTIIRAYGLK